MDDIDVAVRAVLAGNRAMYRGIMETCESSVRLVVASILHDDGSVDDVVNEVFLTAYLKLREYRLGTDFGAWARSIAWHKARNERRRRWRTLATPNDPRGPVFELVEAEVDELAGSAAPDAQAKLHECLNTLPTHTRDVVVRHYFDGVACSDIGRAAGRREGWARLVLFRARAALVRCLKGKGAFAGGLG